LGSVFLYLVYGIVIAGDNDKREGNPEKAKPPHHQATTDTAAIKAS
jgi:hypothetical protein